MKTRERPVDTPAPAPRRLLPVPEAAHALGISPAKCWALIADKRLASVTIDRRRLVPQESIDALVAELMAEAG